MTRQAATPHRKTLMSGKVFDALDGLAGISRIAAGPISRAPSAPPRVKIGEAGGAITLLVRGACDVQELYAYGRSIAAAKLSIARRLRDRGIPIRFK